MPTNETARHLELKRLALEWAQAHGYRIAATEVSAPDLGARLDVAAFRPANGSRRRTLSPQGAAAGVTAIFECKQSRADFLKDSRCAEKLAERLAKLRERQTRYESSMRLHLPSLRQADTLFPEFDSYRFETAGYEPYDRLLKELRTLALRLHAQTKFSDLYRWRAANLHYLVAEEGIAQPHELPPGWGLLVRTASRLELKNEPTWQEATEDGRTALLLRIAMAGTTAVNRLLGVTLPEFSGRPRQKIPPPLKGPPKDPCC